MISKLSFIDTNGKMVLIQKANSVSGNIVVDISRLKPGVYFIQVETEGIKTIKLIKQ